MFLGLPSCPLLRTCSFSAWSCRLDTPGLKGGESCVFRQKGRKNKKNVPQKNANYPFMVNNGGGAQLSMAIRSSRSLVVCGCVGGLVNQWILPIGGFASGRVCACSLFSRLVHRLVKLYCFKTHSEYVATLRIIILQVWIVTEMLKSLRGILRFSPTRPSGPSWSSSCYVQLYVVCMLYVCCMSPPREIYFEASH